MTNPTPGLPDELEWEGKPITEPGIYRNVPMTTYHEQLTDTPSISSGGLRKIDGESLLHYHDDSYLNPDRAEQTPSDALKFGRATHLLFGGEKGFREQFCIRPATYVDEKTGEEKPWSGNSSACKRWLGQAAKDGLEVLKAEDVDAIRGMANALARHPAIREGMLGGAVERTLVWRDWKTGVWLKARPDAIPLSSNMIVDLKTCASADPVFVRRAIGDHAYHMQLALAGMGMRALTGRDMTDYVLVFIEKGRPFGINIKPLDPLAIEYGRRQLRRAIDKFAASLESGDWPGYDDDMRSAGLPGYLATRLAKEAEDKDLPPDEQPPALFDPAAGKATSATAEAMKRTRAALHAAHEDEAV